MLAATREKVVASNRRWLQSLRRARILAKTGVGTGVGTLHHEAGNLVSVSCRLRVDTDSRGFRKATGSIPSLPDACPLDFLGSLRLVLEGGTDMNILPGTVDPLRPSAFLFTVATMPPSLFPDL